MWAVKDGTAEDLPSAEVLADSSQHGVTTQANTLWEFAMAFPCSVCLLQRHCSRTQVPRLAFPHKTALRFLFCLIFHYNVLDWKGLSLPALLAVSTLPSVFPFVNINQNLNSYWIHFLSGYLSTKHSVQKKVSWPSPIELGAPPQLGSQSCLNTAVLSSAAKRNALENQDHGYKTYWFWGPSNHPGPCKTPLSPLSTVQAS